MLVLNNLPRSRLGQSRDHSSEPRPSIRAATVRERMPHARLKLARLEHGHGITLLTHDILNRRRNVLWPPQPSSAAMACPSLTVRLIQPYPIQPPAGVSFEVRHDPRS